MIVLMAVLELISGAYALAVVQLVVPGIAAGVVVLVLRRDAYRGLVTGPILPERFWIAAPIAIGTAAVLVVTLAMVGTGWYPGNLAIDLFRRTSAPRWSRSCTTARRTPWRSPSWWSPSPSAPGSSSAGGAPTSRRSIRLLQQRRQREELARRRRDDREQGRRRPARDDS